MDKLLLNLAELQEIKGKLSMKIAELTIQIDSTQSEDKETIEYLSQQRDLAIKQTSELDFQILNIMTSIQKSM